MTGVMLNKGQHTIELAYDLPYFKKGLLLCALGLLLYAGALIYTLRKNHAN